MKISIITVSFNSAKTIEDTIQCVLNQTYKDIEYIVVDGASRDETPNIIQKYKAQISKVISEPDYGIYDAMNKGIRAATGDVVAFLNADDTYVGNMVVERVAQAFQEYDKDSVYGDLCYVSEENPNEIIRYWKAGNYSENSFLNGWMPPHPTFFVKKSVLDQFGGFDPKFRLSGDYELILRLLYKHKISAHYIPFCLVKMRVGGSGNKWIENRLMSNLEDRIAWKKNKLKFRLYTPYLKPMRKIFQFAKMHPKAAFLT